MSNSSVSRRRFMGSAFASSACVALIGAASSSEINAQEAKKRPFRTSFSNDGRVAKIYSDGVAQPVKILQISDSHLFLDDERGEPYRQYSDRMAKAYNHTKRFSDGKDTNPTEMFAEIAAQAKDQGYDAIALTGDIVSFPSAAGVDYAKEQLESIGAPYYYVCGNHDWHFEGMDGTEKDLRDEWIEKRLRPLYPIGVNPLAYSVVVKGVKLLFFDDSIYEILPEQLEFLRKELEEGLPTLAFMHIPLYAPGRRVAYGVGHPDWNAAHDQDLYKIERRRQWPKEGHTPTTYAFRDEMINAPNMIGVFTGHIHSFTLDVLNGTPSSVANAANNGSTLHIEVLPYPN